jgi:chromosome segregation ATPase
MQAIKSVVTRFVPFFSAGLLAFSIGAFAQSQAPAAQDSNSPNVVSLGDVARQQRTIARRKAKRVFTGDDIKSSDAVVSQPSVSKLAETATGDKDKDKNAKAENPDKEREKAFVDAIETQKKRIADAQKKIQDLNSERRQRASAQYADMGLLLRDPQKWNNDEKSLQAEIADKQKEIEDATAKLEEAREAARKAGVKLSD